MGSGEEEDVYNGENEDQTIAKLFLALEVKEDSQNL